MARKRSVNTGATENDNIEAGTAGEGNGTGELSPRPSDSPVQPVSAAGKEINLTPGQLSDAVRSGLPEPMGAGVPVNIYPFGWQRADLRRFVALSITAIVALVFLWYVQAILAPFLIAFFLAALFEPTLREFEKHGRTRVRGILTLYLAGICVLTIIAFIVIPRVVKQASEISNNLSVYITSIQQSADAFMKAHKSMLSKIGIQQSNISALISAKAAPIQNVLTNVLAGVTGALAGLASRALWLIIIPLSTFFFMRDYPMLRARIIIQFPERFQERIDFMSREVMDVFSAYLRGLAKICSLYSVVAFILYSILGLKYALILGLFAGVFYAVPYVGQLFTAVGTGVIAYMMQDHNILFFIHLDLPLHSVPYTVCVVIIAVVVQNVFDQILYPRIVGGSVGLHPVASIFALMAGATLFGIWGMLFAVPVAASIQILIMYFFPKVRMVPSVSMINVDEAVSEPA